MEKARAKEVAAAYFPSYPTVNTFHVTSDEQAFENAEHARSHGATLKDKEVVAIDRDEDGTGEEKGEADEEPEPTGHYAKGKLSYDGPEPLPYTQAQVYGKSGEHTTEEKPVGQTGDTATVETTKHD